ncbi:unnamed protein product [Lampetra fluviatilis]
MGVPVTSCQRSFDASHTPRRGETGRRDGQDGMVGQAARAGRKGRPQGQADRAGRKGRRLEDVAPGVVAAGGLAPNLPSASARREDLLPSVGFPVSDRHRPSPSSLPPSRH